MRNSTGSMAVHKSNVVEIKDDDDDDEENENGDQESSTNQDEEDATTMTMDMNGAHTALQSLHSSLLLPHAMDLMDAAAATASASDYPSIPHFLMDDLLMDGGGGDAEECKCEVCGKVFGKLTSLHMHSFQHDPNKEMKCIFCNFLFLQRSSLNRHYRCRNTLHTCQACKEAFCSHLNLRQHACQQQQDGDDRSYITQENSAGGGVGVSAMDDADEYLEMDSMGVGGGDNLMSRKRNRSGQAMSSLVASSGGGINSEDVSGRDESIELSDTEPDSLACMLCPSVLNTKAEVDQHVATEHGTVTKCTICFKSFRSPTILHIHMAARASKKNKIECPNCTHRFNKQAEFRKHFMYHTMKENRPETSDEAIYSRIASKYPGK